jgi:hypothetical protein
VVWASSTEGASTLHCAQPGAQNHNTTGRPDAPRSTVGSINNSLEMDPVDVSSDDLMSEDVSSDDVMSEVAPESTGSEPHPALIMEKPVIATTTDTAIENVRIRLMTSR